MVRNGLLVIHGFISWCELCFATIHSSDGFFDQGLLLLGPAASECKCRPICSRTLARSILGRWLLAAQAAFFLVLLQSTRGRCFCFFSKSECLALDCFWRQGVPKMATVSLHLPFPNPKMGPESQFEMIPLPRRLQVHFPCS